MARATWSPDDRAWLDAHPGEGLPPARPYPQRGWYEWNRQPRAAGEPLAPRARWCFLCGPPPGHGSAVFMLRPANADPARPWNALSQTDIARWLAAHPGATCSPRVARHLTWWARHFGG